MKQKIAHFIGGFIIYGSVALLLVFFFNKEMLYKWEYIIVFAVGMSLAELLVIHPWRKKLSKEKAGKQPS